MTEKFSMEQLVAKTGGPFNLTVLLQKRVKELKAGARKLVDLDSKDLLEIASQEILEGKIELVPEEEPTQTDEARIRSRFKSET